MPQQKNTGNPLGLRGIPAIELLESRTLMSATWFVSTTGSDSNSGTIASPLRTIQRAANAALPGDTVEIRGGVYRETVTPRRSGTAAAPITFEAYNHESVTVSGANLITGWTSNGDISHASQNWDLGEGNNQVFVDGRMMTEARWPNTSLDVSHPTLAHAQSATATATTATYHDSSLTQANGYWNGAIIHFTAGQAWVAGTGIVTGSGRGFVTFSYQRADGYETPSAGDAYYLMGKFAALDSPGEWYRDPSNSQLYLWTPSSDDPNGHVVEARARQFVFDLRNVSNITIRGLNIFAASIDTGRGSSNVVIDHVNAQYVSHYTTLVNGWVPPYDTGIVLNGDNDVLQNSEIAYSAGDGVYIGGSNCRVTNNIIHDVDYDAGDAAAVRIYASGTTTVDHNTIYNAGRDGVSHRLSRVMITYNTIHDVMLQTTDGGATYAEYTDGKGSEIAYNRIYNIHTGGYGGDGIFLDADCSNFVIAHNAVWNVDSALKLNASSRNEQVLNNTLAGTGASVAMLWGGGDWSKTNFINNIYTAKVSLGSGAGSWCNLNAGTNPDFANVAAGNLSLQSDSPAIDAGAVMAPYTNGYVGEMPDMGAMEFGLAPFASGAQVTGLPTVPTVPAAPPPPPPPPPPTVKSSYRSARSTLQAENYDVQQGIGLKYQGIGYADGGDWVGYKQIDFSSGVTTLQMNLAVMTPWSGQRVEVRIDSQNGPTIAALSPRATTAWNNYTVQTASVSKVTGVHDVYLVFIGTHGIANVDWLKFS